MRTADADTLIVGAGPHALAACAYLLSAPTATTAGLLVVDPQRWMARWNRRLRTLDVRTLRSSCVHHPDPDPCALLTFAHDHGRDTEVEGRHNLPSTSLFADFCADLVERLVLDEVRIPQRAVRLRAEGALAAVQLADGSWLRAHRVVLATNPSLPRVPAWARPSIEEAPAARTLHSDDVRIDAGPLGGERILVVGGGLTAAQLALGAAARGANPVLVSRSPLRERDFDVPPGWFSHHLEEFHAEGRWERRAAVLDAERRGSVPPAELAGLRVAHACRRLVLMPGRAVHGVSWSGASGEALIDEERRPVDRVWLATGHAFHVAAEPLLEELCHSHPVRVAGGLPVLDAQCRWPGTAVHLMGGLAALQVGPLARNIAGARMAAERIAAGAGRQAPPQYPWPRAAGRTENLPPPGAPSRPGRRWRSTTSSKPAR